MCRAVQGWGSLLGGITGGGGGAESGGGGDADGGGADSGGGGMLGSTSSMLSSSMKSMGIGKKDDESALSVGRVRSTSVVLLLLLCCCCCCCCWVTSFSCFTAADSTMPCDLCNTDVCRVQFGCCRRHG